MPQALGSPWLHLPSCESTSDEARRLGKAGQPHGAVVTADAQTRGRGRQGRTWYSPPGENLYLSLLLRPELLPREVPLLTLCAGLAVLAAAASVLRRHGCRDSPLRLKWPNDLLAETPTGMCKVAGILTELSLSGPRCDFVVVGIGCNVSGLDFPSDLPATSLRQLLSPTQPPLSVHDFAVTLLDHFEPLYQRFLRDGAAWVRQAFADSASVTAPGRWLEVSTALGMVRGESLGIDHDGALLIRKEDGFVERLLAGDVTFHPTSRYG